MAGRPRCCPIRRHLAAGHASLSCRIHLTGLRFSRVGAREVRRWSGIFAGDERTGFPEIEGFHGRRLHWIMTRLRPPSLQQRFHPSHAVLYPLADVRGADRHIVRVAATIEDVERLRSARPASEQSLLRERALCRGDQTRRKTHATHPPFRFKGPHSYALPTSSCRSISHFQAWSNRELPGATENCRLGRGARQFPLQ